MFDNLECFVILASLLPIIFEQFGYWSSGYGLFNWSYNLECFVVLASQLRIIFDLPTSGSALTLETIGR
jgi:hypothetical protein